MRLIRFPPSRVDTAVQQLPEPDMVVDPRPIWYEYYKFLKYYKFKVTVNGTTLMITRTDPPKNRHPVAPTGWKYAMRFRVYNINEDRYSFKSTQYIFHGFEDEEAPDDTTEVIIKDGIETIRRGAFYGRNSLVKVTIPGSVKRIEEVAFDGCKSLRFIQLPPNLEYIGGCAFYDCSSLEAVFLPPTIRRCAFTHCNSLVKVAIPKSVKRIEGGAFARCYSLRIIQLPSNLEYIGTGAFKDCRSLEAVFLPYIVRKIHLEAFHGCRSLRILNIPDSERFGRNAIEGCKSLLTDEVKEVRLSEWLRNRYNKLHDLCCQLSPSPQAIQHFIQGHSDNEVRARTNDKPQFTALHLLAANPSVTGDMITAFLQLAPDVAAMHNEMRQSPLHMLCSAPHFSDETGDAIRAYLSFSEGKKAAFDKGVKRRTPFERVLFAKSFDDIPFLENKSFAGLMVWWYDCLDINLFMDGANV